MLDSGHTTDDSDTCETHNLQVRSSVDGPCNNTLLSASVKGKLYLSHALSTWNSRVFEFGSVLFLSTIFPGTLLPASVYALARATSAILFSGLVGHFIDHGERMRVIRISIGTLHFLFGQFFTQRTNIADFDQSASG